MPPLYAEEAGRVRLVDHYAARGAGVVLSLACSLLLYVRVMCSRGLSTFSLKG